MATTNDRLTEQFPRLAVVIGDFHVSRSAGGALLLYRLLQGYPAERLLICEARAPTADQVEFPELDGVRYVHLPYRFPRWALMRFNPAWPLFASASIERQTGPLVVALESFQPDAILTVPHGFYWLTAAAAARRLNRPLHLIYYDDWPSQITRKRPGWVGRLVRLGCRGLVRRVYRQAAARLCVSPGMEEYCQSMFDCPGQVLYPSRGPDSPVPRLRWMARKSDSLVVAYAGTLLHTGDRALLRQFAELLASWGGRLDLYSPHDPGFLSSNGLDHPNIRLVGFFPASEMAERVAATAVALLLLASFEEAEQLDVATLFPSKLADYTGIGLPIVIWGPRYSSAARWAAENPGATVCVTDPDPTALKAALSRLLTDPLYAVSVTIAGIEAGRRYFDVSEARETFSRAITQKCTAYGTGWSLRGGSESQSG